MPVDKLSLVVFSGDFDRVHYALVLAAGAAASNIACTVFFTMQASHAVLEGPGWHRLHTAQGSPPAQQQDQDLQARNVAGFEELLESCVALGVRFMLCEMGLRALQLEGLSVRADIPVSPGGVVTFLADSSANGSMMMI